MQQGRDWERMQMLDLAPYGLAGLVAILLVAFFFARKTTFAFLADKHSSQSIDDAELRRPKDIERCMCEADTGSDGAGQKHEAASNG